MQDEKKISNEVTALVEKIEYQKKYIGSLQDQLKNIDQEIQKLNRQKLNDASNQDLKSEIDKRLEDRYKIDKTIPFEEKTLSSLQNELNLLKDMLTLAKVQSFKAEYEKLGLKRFELNQRIVDAIEVVTDTLAEIIELDKHQRNAGKRAGVRIPNRLYTSILEDYVGWKLPFLSMPNTRAHNRRDLNELDYMSINKKDLKKTVTK